jgi:cytochrome c oxidase subunit 2
MWVMHAPSPRPRLDRAEPGGTLLFLLFFGGLIAAGVVGVWLWNSNPSVQQGRAFGTPNQVGAPVKPGQPPAQKPGGAPGVDPALVQQGQQLAQQFGCLACHTTTGQPSVGPTWKGLFGHQHQLANGQTVTVDEAYLRESILQPDATVVQGFPPGVMAAAVTAIEPQLQQGNNVDALIAYIQSLR